MIRKVKINSKFLHDPLILKGVKKGIVFFYMNILHTKLDLNIKMLCPIKKMSNIATLKAKLEL